MRRVDPKQVVLGMIARGCAECKSVQHVWFKNTEEWDGWDCPICAGRIEDDDDFKPPILIDMPDEPVVDSE